jgi:hypothetical protein
VSAPLDQDEELDQAITRILEAVPQSDLTVAIALLLKPAAAHTNTHAHALDQLTRACVRATSAAAAELQRTSRPCSERATDFDFQIGKKNVEK